MEMFAMFGKVIWKEEMRMARRAVERIEKKRRPIRWPRNKIEGSNLGGYAGQGNRLETCGGGASAEILLRMDVEPANAEMLNGYDHDQC